MTRPQLWPWLLDQSSSIFLISMTPLLHIPFIIHYSSPSFFAVKTENQDQTTADLRVSVWLRLPCLINLRPKFNTKQCPHLEVILLLHWKVFVYIFVYKIMSNCLFFYLILYFLDHLKPEGIVEKVSEVQANYRNLSPVRPMIHKLKDHLKVSCATMIYAN